MKKIKRKNNHCLNCGAEFDDSTNYCPRCGQENTNNYQSVKILMGDFLNNYFSFDSRFIRTIPPFLFKPGLITNEFVDGKRLKYAHPIRWYLVISLFHFFFFNLMVNSENSDNNINNRKAIRFNSGNTYNSQEEIDSLLSTPDSLRYSYDDDWQVNEFEYGVMIAMTNVDSFSVAQIYDSLNLDDKPFLERASSTIMIKSFKSKTGELNSYIFEKIPMIMFFILPLYGLLLKVFFYKKGLYIKHLIHSLHIHSLFFFLFTFVWIINLIAPDIANYIIGLALFLITLYITISFKNVYRQKYPIVILKMLGTGILYQILASLVLLIGILISMLFM
jgi:hypothetical protein